MKEKETRGWVYYIDVYKIVKQEAKEFIYIEEEKATFLFLVHVEKPLSFRFGFIISIMSFHIL